MLIEKGFVRSHLFCNGDCDALLPLHEDPATVLHRTAKQFKVVLCFSDYRHPIPNRTGAIAPATRRGVDVYLQ